MVKISSGASTLTMPELIQDFSVCPASAVTRQSWMQRGISFAEHSFAFWWHSRCMYSKSQKPFKRDWDIYLYEFSTTSHFFVDISDRNYEMYAEPCNLLTNHHHNHHHYQYIYMFCGHFCMGWCFVNRMQLMFLLLFERISTPYS